MVPKAKVSRDTVHRLFSEPRLPELNVLLEVVSHLAELARGVDVESELDRFDGLWRAVSDGPAAPRDPRGPCAKLSDAGDVDLNRQRYVYLGERILRDRLVQLRMRDEQDRPSVAGSTPSLYQVAREVTRGVQPSTGSLWFPRRYVRGSFQMHWSGVQILSRPDLEVAWFAATVDTTTGPIFVALCGSVHNFVGYDGERQRMPFHRYPSTPDGMLRALEEITEDRMPPPAERRAAVDFAVQSAFAFSRVRPIEQVTVGDVEVLFEPFYQAEDVETRNGEYRLGLVGAPLWVATAAAPVAGRY
jgi:hypothetical protein